MPDEQNAGAMRRAVDSLLKQKTNRRGALRLFGYGAVSASPMTMAGCGPVEAEDKKTVADASVQGATRSGAVRAQATSAPNFTFGQNSGDTVQQAIYDIRLSEESTSVRTSATDNWGTISGAVGSRVVLLLWPDLQVALNAQKPAGASVASVDDLRLTLYQFTNHPAPVTCTIYAVAQGHTRNQETYANAEGGTAWQAAGVTRGAVLGTITFGREPGARTSTNLAALYTNQQAMAHGIVIAHDENEVVGCWMSESTSDDGKRPYFSVAYSYNTGSQASFNIGLNSGDQSEAIFDTRLSEAQLALGTSATDNWGRVCGSTGDRVVVLSQPNLSAALDALKPAGASVASVDDVRLRVYQISTGHSAAVTCTIYAVAQPHTQGRETFTSADVATDTAWQTPGVTRGAALGTITFGTGEGFRTSTNLSAIYTDAQAMANGIVIVHTGRESVAMWMSEKSAPDGYRARFEVTYTYQADANATTWGVGSDVYRYDWTPSPMVDLVKWSRGWGGFGLSDAYDGNDQLTVALDADGDPTTAASLVLTSAAYEGGMALGTYLCSYSGPGNVSVGFGQATIRDLVRSGNEVTFNLVVTGLEGIRLDFTAATKHLRVLLPGYPRSTTQLLTREGMAHWKKFKCLRNLNWHVLNFDVQRAEKDWSAREKPNKWHGRPSWEAFFQFCTEIHNEPGSKLKEVWLCTPPDVDASYVRNLANLANALLPQGMVIWFELCNEWWNWSYPHAWRSQRMAYDPNNYRNNYPTDDPGNVALWINSPDYARVAPSFPGFWTNRWSPMQGLRVARMATAIRDANPALFGTRFRPVLAGQHVNAQLTGKLVLDYLAEPAQVAEFGPIKSYLYALATGPYVSGNVAQMASASSVAEFINGLRSGWENDLTSISANAVLWNNIRKSHGIPQLVAYECGIGLNDASNQAAKYAVHTSPAIRPFLVSYGTVLRDAGFTLLVWLSASPMNLNPNNPDDCWGTLRSYSDTSDTASKQKAVDDLIALSGQ